MSASAPIPGTASRDPTRLCPCVRERYYQLQGAALEDGILTRLIETLRDRERQAHYIAIGTSWTEESLHLPQPPNGLALAFDLAPTEYLPMKGWNPGGPLWRQLGRLGKATGLLWGGDWRTTPDRPHFYLEQCECPRAKPETTVA